jgi:hypothetical protein
MNHHVIMLCVVGLFGLPVLPARSLAQGGTSVHVCVGVDRVIRFAPGTSCPAGQASYNLALDGTQPTPPDEDKTLANQISDLRKTIDLLRDRVSNLEHELAKESDLKNLEHVIRAPLQVVDKTGNAIFTVTDASYGQATVGRVHVGRGTGNNYGIWVQKAGGGVAAAIGEGKTGGGVVSVNDPAGKPRAELFGQGGVTVYNPSGKDVVSLNLNAANTASGVMQLTGIFQILDGGGQTIVEAGRLPTGVGVVRVGPGTKCVPMGTLRVGDCIMGRREP